MANQGFKLALPGKSILSKDPRDYILWSKYPPLKIIKYGQGVINAASGGGDTSLTVKHGLGYKPAHLAFFENDNNGRFWIDRTKLGAGNSTYTDGGSGAINGVDSENITFNYTPHDANARDVPFKYLLFDQSAYDALGGNDKPIGYTTANSGMKISPNSNVFTSKLYQQAVNSNCDYLKYHTTIVGKLSGTNNVAGQAFAEHVHGLGYPPVCVAYGYFDTDVKETLLPIGRAPNPFASGVFVDTYKAGIDIIWAGSGSPVSFNFYYRLVIFKNNLLSVL